MTSPPRTWAYIRALKDGEARYHLVPGPSAPTAKRLFGIPALTPSQISVVEGQGSSRAACSWVALADMAQTAVARMQELELRYSTDFKSERPRAGISSP